MPSRVLCPPALPLVQAPDLSYAAPQSPLLYATQPPEETYCNVAHQRLQEFVELAALRRQDVPLWHLPLLDLVVSTALGVPDVQACYYDDVLPIHAVVYREFLSTHGPEATFALFVGPPPPLTSQISGLRVPAQGPADPWMTPHAQAPMACMPLPPDSAQPIPYFAAPQSLMRYTTMQAFEKTKTPGPLPAHPAWPVQPGVGTSATLSAAPPLASDAPKARWRPSQAEQHTFISLAAAHTQKMPPAVQERIEMLVAICCGESLTSIGLRFGVETRIARSLEILLAKKGAHGAWQHMSTVSYAAAAKRGQAEARRRCDPADLEVLVPGFVEDAVFATACSPEPPKPANHVATLEQRHYFARYARAHMWQVPEVVHPRVLLLTFVCEGMSLCDAAQKAQISEGTASDYLRKIAVWGPKRAFAHFLQPRVLKHAEKPVIWHPKKPKKRVRKSERASDPRHLTAAHPIMVTAQSQADMPATCILGPRCGGAL